MTTLTEFLLARIAEDKAAARAAVRWSEGASEWATDGEPDWLHIARHDPARVLAECEAKRRIVERHASSGAAGTGCYICSEFERQTVDCYEQRALAMVYADHPDYREEWRP